MADSRRKGSGFSGGPRNKCSGIGNDEVKVEKDRELPKKVRLRSKMFVYSRKKLA
ncbi:hypothetical protein QUF78_15040 [Peribacillus sp. ACCC06369]|nr:hypothetical protein [Peribacillus sp. ACCC06369]